MAVFRLNHTHNFTILSNQLLKDKKLSLKAKGLLAQMLSLRDDWDFTLAGLTAINPDGIHAVRSAVRELERGRYLKRRQLTSPTGRFLGNEYVIYEQPFPSENSLSKNSTTEESTTKMHTQLSTNPSSTKGLSTQESIIPPETAINTFRERKDRTDGNDYRELICENIDYDKLCCDIPHDRDRLDELVELMVETVTAERATTRVSGTHFPHNLVRGRLLKLGREHMCHVLSCLQENTTNVRNIKAYLLTALFNAPATMANHYTAQVGHDLYGPKEDFS